jgi:excinuclease ABC subunit B
MPRGQTLQVPLERPTAKAPFRLALPWDLAGDQPKASAGIVEALGAADRHVTLRGVTGSGKTVTMAKVIAEAGRPALVLAHNKTLAAQLYGEFKEFFPENAVQYFVSYYDYYQPEAYIPRTDVYIEKDSSRNEEIDKMRHAATRALFERRDVIIVASVSCIYGLGAPVDYGAVTVRLNKGERVRRDTVLRHLVDILYERTNTDLSRGKFRVRGDTLEIQPAYEDLAVRIEFFGDDVERITELDPLTGEVLAERDRIDIYPARHFVTPREKLLEAIKDIEAELVERLAELENAGRLLEAQRLRQRTNFDLEMLRETGTCAGVENYSRHLARRPAGSRPWTLLDYFPPDFLAFIDESHISIPQVRGMYGGDRSRKEILVEYGFRLPSALDNRPLTFEEFEQRLDQTVYVSATPGPYELERSPRVVEQIIRPTGLIDPEIDVRKTEGQIDDLLAEINARVAKGQRALVTTLTKKMAEDLADYLREMGVKVHYLHSEIETLQRVEILRDLRLGVYDVVVGVNLLREGIDLPEVTLVAILDADKEGYLRSEGSLIQVIGRAARHVEGRVIMYADRITASMKAAIDETERRRDLQIAYNGEHGIEPQTVVKAIRDIGLRLRDVADVEGVHEKARRPIAAGSLPKDDLARLIKDLESQMKQAAKELEFERAAALRDEVVELRGLLVLQEGPESIEAGAEPVRTTTRVVRAGQRRRRRGP